MKKLKELINQIKDVRQMTKIAIIAAVYVALCLALAPVSYGAIQFRISEIMLVLPFYNKKYGISLVLGTFIANIFSPMGIYDMIFGTVASVLVCVVIVKLKNKKFIALAAGVINGIIIGMELYFVLNLNLILSMIYVAVGEFVVVLIGVLVFTGIEKVNRKFINLLRE
ncbi:MAG: QueT transporter family protein [Oscillospiraceae bacterium]|nr:QueT transporter family protein [Oscillospiraceae bacterium]